jgi:hypothetical protein
MQYGAVKHHSKQYLIDNGLYKKQLMPSDRHSVHTASQNIQTDETSTQTDPECDKPNSTSITQDPEYQKLNYTCTEANPQEANLGEHVCKICQKLKENFSDRRVLYDDCSVCFCNLSSNVCVLHNHDDEES